MTGVPRRLSRRMFCREPRPPLYHLWLVPDLARAHQAAHRTVGRSEHFSLTRVGR